MSLSYQQYGFNSQLQRTTSIPARPAPFTTGHDFEGNYERSVITQAKIKNASITSAKIVDANITSAKIADASVTTAKIVDANVTNAKIDTVAAGKITVGTLLAAVNVGTAAGGAYVKLDGANTQILINDGTVDRILIGFDSGGF